jgi:acyl-CoA synthetase (AMP-forming)/AMP-acid ligase II
VQPQGFVAIPLVHAVRVLLRRHFRSSRFHVTVGRRWFWRGMTLQQLRTRGRPGEPERVTSQESPAAIIFTTGSTGPPKGVLYHHRQFIHQARQIQQAYQIEAGEIDLPGFPLFALFNCAMGVSTVIPDMDPTRPAKVDPRKIMEAVRDWQVTQSFGSPALWNTVGRYCEEHQVRLESLRRVLSAGAPVPPHVLRRVRQAMHPEGELHTPYGATEALPVASISATQVLSDTAKQTRLGRGTCVGTRYPGIQWKVIRISDQPLDDITQVQELPEGQIGELMVSGPVVTEQYVAQPQANALHKVRDGDRIWHRMGDVGYLDEQERFWFCGRKAHRVQTAQGTLYPVMCEAVLNEHPDIYRSALVGVGPPGRQMPVLIAEPWPQRWPGRGRQRHELIEQLRQLAAEHPQTSGIRHFLLHKSLPVDIRHNAKIFREQLAVWAAQVVKLPLEELK